MRDQRQVIQALREHIQRIERRPPQAGRVLATGSPDVDALLGGGLPRGALVDLRGGAGCGKTALALRALAGVTAEGGLGAYVDGRGELYAPAAAALGVALERLLVVRPQLPALRGSATRGASALRDALWAGEALLASGAFALVVIDTPVQAGGRDADGGATVEGMLRRLRTAAEKGGAAGVWLAEPGESRVAGALRLHVDPGARCGDAPLVRGEAPRLARRVERGHAA